VEEGGHFVEEKALAGAIGLYPFTVKDELGDGALTGVSDDLGCGAWGGFDVDLGVGDGMVSEETLGLAAVATPCGGVNE